MTTRAYYILYDVTSDISFIPVDGKSEYGDMAHAKKRADTIYKKKVTWRKVLGNVTFGYIDDEVVFAIARKVKPQTLRSKNTVRKNPASMNNQLWRKLGDFVITLRTANRAQLEDAITGLKQGAADFGLPPTDRAIYKKLLPLLRKELRDFSPKREKYSRLPNPKKNPEIETRELSLYADNLGPSSQGIEKEVYAIREKFGASVRKNRPKKELMNLAKHAAHRAARAYSHVHGSGAAHWQEIFNDKDLNDTAKYLYDSFYEEYSYTGNPRKKNPATPNRERFLLMVKELQKFSKDELFEFSTKHQRGRGAMGLGFAGKGSRTLVNDLANFAANIGAAKTTTGDTKKMYERIAHDILTDATKTEYKTRKKNPNKKKTGYFVFKCKGTEVEYMILPKFASFGWTPTIGSSALFSTKKDANSFVRIVASSVPHWQLGIATGDTTKAQILTKCKKGKA